MESIFTLIGLYAKIYEITANVLLFNLHLLPSNRGKAVAEF